MENKKLDLSAPWYTCQKKLKALFAYDDDVTVEPVFNGEEGPAVTLTVRGSAKAAALRQLLPENVIFGTVTLYVNIVQDASAETPADVLKAAFAHNPLLWKVETVTDGAGVEHTYAVFEPEVLQFFNDDLSDYRGNFTALAADVAKELFVGIESMSGGVHICTADITENAE